MKTYNKIVRDKIKDIIEANSEVCETKILSKEEAIIELDKKLQEEVLEYLESGEIEEIADIEEVLRAILDLKNCSYDDFEKIRLDKVEKRGAFKKRLFLESTKQMGEE